MGAAIAQRDSELNSRLARELPRPEQTTSTLTPVRAARAIPQPSKWLVETVQNATDKPLAIDSDVPEVIAAGLKKIRGEKVLINSITAEPGRLAAICPLAAERRAPVVALAMGKEGIPTTVEKRLEACAIIMEYTQRQGIAAGQIYFDPLVLPIGVDESQGKVTLETIKKIKERFPEAKTTVGLSNISYGLPGRRLINRSFLLMAIGAGLDSAFLDPLDGKIMSAVMTARLLEGSDARSRRYMKAYRQGKILE